MENMAKIRRSAAFQPFLLLLYLPADADFFGSAAFMSPGSKTGAASLFLLTRSGMTPWLWKALFNPGKNLCANRTESRSYHFTDTSEKRAAPLSTFNAEKCCLYSPALVIACSDREKTHKTFTGGPAFTVNEAQSVFGMGESVKASHLLTHTERQTSAASGWIWGKINPVKAEN